METKSCSTKNTFGYTGEGSLILFCNVNRTSLSLDFSRNTFWSTVEKNTMFANNVMIVSLNHVALRPHWNTLLYCTILYCTVLYCTVLYFTVLYCTVLYFTVLHNILLYAPTRPPWSPNVNYGYVNICICELCICICICMLDPTSINQIVI